MKIGPKVDVVDIAVKKVPPPSKLGKGAGPSAPSADDDEGMDPGKVSAANDVIRAVKAGDAEGLAAAMHDLIKLCSYDEE